MAIEFRIPELDEASPEFLRGGSGKYGYRVGKDATTTIKLTGLKEVRKQLKEYGDATKTALKPANLAAAKVVIAAANYTIPVLTGTLKSTMRPLATNKSGKVRVGNAKVEYAGPIHFGWPSRLIKPQPFIYEALDQRINEVISIYNSAIDELGRKYDLN
jgi:HK97 gp10 family phage protein